MESVQFINMNITKLMFWGFKRRGVTCVDLYVVHLAFFVIEK